VFGDAGTDRRVPLAVAGVAALALAARLVALDARPFHWDEARVGYWALRYAETGRWSYRPVAGGPLLYHAVRLATAVLGETDAVARLPVALAGGLLPLVALVFRDRLDDAETVLLALLLAANPLLLAGSRFLRGDVVAAGAGLLVLGALARLAAGDRGHAPLAGVAAALALGASGFAVAYPVALGVGALVALDHERVSGSPSVARDRAAAVLGRLAGAPAALAGGLVAFLGTYLALFLPRPLALSGVRRAFVDAPRAFLGVRVTGRRAGGTHEILPYLADTVTVVAVGALPLAALALFAVLRARYGYGGRRPVVETAAYTGLFGLFLFPVVAESFGPWVAVHAVVFLAVPAAVGAGTLYRAGAAAFDRGAARDVAAVGLVVGAAVAGTGAVVTDEVYGAPSPDDRLATYGQPADDLEPVYRVVEDRTGAGTDVLLFGDDFFLRPEGRADAPPVPERFAGRLPLAWYLERADADVRSATRPEALSTPPPVVVARASDRAAVAARLDGYEATTYRTALWNRRTVVFVRTASGSPSPRSAPGSGSGS
jgi:uncharacterized protein (TIGR03663 family)